MPRTTQFVRFFEKWTAPLAALTALFAGAAWLNDMHNLAVQNQIEIEEIKEDVERFKTKISLRLNNVDNRLARIEGKIDLLIQDRTLKHR